MTDEKSKFYKCACSGHAIQTVEYKDEPQLYISIWEQGSHCDNSLTFVERIRWCWRVLRKGKPFDDEVVLNPLTVEQLHKDLGEFVENHKNKT